ncbi:MAG: tyrosine-type recombinase/integrase, partial [Gammaproteobacteria bacterium]
EMLTPEECGRVLEMAEPKVMRCALAMALYLGLRKNEVLGFPVKNVHAEERTVTIYSTKTNFIRDMPIPSELWPILRAQLARASGEFLFGDSEGNRPRSDTKLERRLRTALRHADVVTGYTHRCRHCDFLKVLSGSTVGKCPNGCRGKLSVFGVPRHINFHGLRHVCATLHQKAGCARLIVQLLLGHKGGGLPLTEQVYTHYSEEDVREHLNKLSFRPKGPKAGGARELETNSLGPPKPKVIDSSSISRAETVDPRSDAILTVVEVAERIQVSRITVTRLIAAGKLAAIRIGSVLRIRESALQLFLDGSAERPS